MEMDGIYKIIRASEVNEISDDNLAELNKYPVKFYWNSKEYMYCIPVPSHLGKWKFEWHHSSKAAKYEFGSECWYYYGFEAINREEFFDPNWRKRAEIKKFL